MYIRKIESSEKRRRKFGISSEQSRGEKLNDTQKKIINLLSDNMRLSATKMAEQLGVSSRSVEKNIKKLKEYGVLIRHGSPKNGYWEVVSEARKD